MNGNLLLKKFPHQSKHLAWLGVAPQLELGKEQLPIHADLKAAAGARDEAKALYLGFEILDQFCCQAHGPVGVVSNHAVFDANIHDLRFS
jgi:hypothetical protein